MQFTFNATETAKQLPVRAAAIDNIHAYERGLNRWVYVSVDMVREYPTCYPYWSRSLPEYTTLSTPTKFITDWRELEVGVLYWMIDRADETDRDIIEVHQRNLTDEKLYVCVGLNVDGDVRFRENTHVFYPVAEAPTPGKDLLYFS